MRKAIGGEALSYKTVAPAFAHTQLTTKQACISRKTFHRFSGKLRDKKDHRSLVMGILRSASHDFEFDISG